MKTTAVEWLVKELQKDFNIEGIQLLYDIVLEKAKEMEKQQIIDAYLKDRPKATINKALDTWDKAEQYYNETYENKENI